MACYFEIVFDFVGGALFLLQDLEGVGFLLPELFFVGKVFGLEALSGEEVELLSTVRVSVQLLRFRKQNGLEIVEL